ncbi:hypothetical protein A2U01_0085181, partial [Trifolium medium]|nr:hypothetical protein [Trifolium medium]
MTSSAQHPQLWSGYLYGLAASLNGEMQKTAQVIQRDCHLPARHMEAADLPVPSLHKSRQQRGIKERVSRLVQ